MSITYSYNIQYRKRHKFSRDVWFSSNTVFKFISDDIFTGKPYKSFFIANTEIKLDITPTPFNSPIFSSINSNAILESIDENDEYSDNYNQYSDKSEKAGINNNPLYLDLCYK